MQCKLLPEKCIACGLCQVLAPAIFDYDNDGLVLFKEEAEAHQQFIPEKWQEQVLNAYRKCPPRAILIKE